MAEYPPRSCGLCPHLAHFEKAADPKHYIPEHTVPKPDMEYQLNYVNMNPQLGTTALQQQQQGYTGGVPPCNDPCVPPDVSSPSEPCPDTPYSLEHAIPQTPCDKVKTKGILKKTAEKIECECPLPMASVPKNVYEDRGTEQPWAVNLNDRPPCYLPQPEDKIPSNKEEGMGPIGPWATGRVDWGPLKGLTGTRPVVDRYSIARYSEGEWRQHNKDILEGKGERAVHRNNLIEWNSRQCMAQTQSDATKNQEDSTRRLQQREKEVHRWKCELERAIAAASEEITFIEEQRRRLKQAAAVLQLPESIAGECLERRTGRLDSELVRDEVEVELLKERALCDEIRQQFIQTLKDIELQLIEDKTAKQRLESDWSDKKQAFELDSTGRGLTLRSSILMFKPGSVIFPGDQSTPEYWEHFTKETLQMSEATRQRSVTLRGTLDSILMNASRDLRSQADKVELILSKRIKCLIEVTDRLEAELKKTLQKLADVENLIDDLQAAIRRMDLCLKKAQTRLDFRLQRQRVENCRDECHFGLIEEVKMIGEQTAALAAQLKQAEDSQAELITGRNELENEIMRKRKSLEIDRFRIQQFRSYYPSATALSGYA
ncbi:hypothetical protein HHI36_005464 [Cryptolaemus montrouzieri]|uniref:Tektin n=1 Tax=Cryptolaemus montrouzieri TaxID=559131 RepID=A0ABD2NU88_9CUCU